MIKTRWYKNTGFGEGDRTLEGQIKGLESLDVRDSTVLELGAAEGLMTKWLLEKDAMFVHAVEIVPEHVEVAHKVLKNWKDHYEFTRADLNTWRTDSKYDVVMALAVFHKCRDPGLVCRELSRAAYRLLVIRNPPIHPTTIIDHRSDFKPFDLRKILEEEGWRLDRTTNGPNNEPTTFWVRA